MQYYQDLDVYKINLADVFSDQKLDGLKLKDDDNILIHKIKISKNLDNIPQLPYIKGLVPYGKKNIENYFSDFAGERFKVINGQCFGCDSYYCDYCKFPINVSDKYKYVCLHCYTDMCHLCYSERSEEDAIKNGATNYHLRKEKLDKCQNNHYLVKIAVNEVVYGEWVCDMCEDVLDEDYWTDYNNEGRYDLCNECAKENSDILREKNMSKFEFSKTDLFYLTEFGNLSDWIPIYMSDYPSKQEIKEYAQNHKYDDDSDDDSDNDSDNDSDDDDDYDDVGSDRDRVADDMVYMVILYNCNKDSPNYQKLALSAVDDHGRTGIYQIRAFHTFEDLKKEVEPLYEEMLKGSIKGGWEAYYNNSIMLLMDKLGMKYHFG